MKLYRIISYFNVLSTSISITLFLCASIGLIYSVYVCTKYWIPACTEFWCRYKTRERERESRQKNIFESLTIGNSEQWTLNILLICFILLLTFICRLFIFKNSQFIEKGIWTPPRASKLKATYKQLLDRAFLFLKMCHIHFYRLFLFIYLFYFSIFP